MKTFACFARRFAIAAFALSVVWLGGTAESRAATGVSCSSSLPAAGGVTSKPVSCLVNCASGGTVANALRLRRRTTNRFTITIQGTCSEAVDDVPGRVTLYGAAAGDGLSAPSSSANPVLGISGGSVVLANLTITGGVNPLLLHNKAGVTGINLVISGGSVDDVLAEGFLNLNNSTVENSAGNGIDVEWGGTVYLEGGTISNNVGWGATVSLNSRLDVDNNAIVSGNTAGGILAVTGGALGVYNGVIENNSHDGILIDNGGVADLFTSSAVVQSNGQDGVEVFGGSLRDRGGVILTNARYGISIWNSGTAILEGSANIASNSSDGVFVMDGTVSVGDLAGNAVIQSNQGNGIHLKTNSVAQFGDSGDQVINNTGWGILCDGTPANPLYRGYAPTVTGNGAGQISCNQAP